MEISATIDLRNFRDYEHTTVLPRGLVIEAASTNYGVQNLALLQEYRVTIPARGAIRVRVVGRCLNRSRSVPRSKPGRITPFKYGGIDFTQSSIWERVSQPAYF